jgi:orotidine-5'-phosphate decarboxylase
VTHSHVIFALDYSSLQDARAAAELVRLSVGMLKIGLFVQAGPEALTLGKQVKLPVFLDLKLHDIPETVERAVGRAAALGARILTVHASGGATMLKRAVTRARASGEELTLAAVTVLTSQDDADLAGVGVYRSARDHAVSLARLAQDAGVTAFVCSPHEARAMRAALGDEATLITPGVRESGAPESDQKRVATAEKAIEEGADWVVVGRPIRDAKDPRAVAERLTSEVATALARRKAHAGTEASS